jgi:Leucine-rich repeat (LRR) protein
LDITASNNSLEILKCDYNKITNLDISDCKELIRLQTIDKKLRLREHIGVIAEEIMSQVRKARERVFAEED